MGSSSSGKAVAPGSFPNGGAPAAGWRNAVAHRTVTAELRHLRPATREVIVGHGGDWPSLPAVSAKRGLT